MKSEFKQTLKNAYLKEFFLRVKSEIEDSNQQIDLSNYNKKQQVNDLRYVDRSGAKQENFNNTGEIHM